MGMAGDSEVMRALELMLGGLGSPTELGESPSRFGTLCKGALCLGPGSRKMLVEHRGRRLAFSQFLSPNREETPEMAAEGAGILGVAALEVPCGQGRGLPPSHWVKAENFIRHTGSYLGPGVLTVFCGLL